MAKYGIGMSGLHKQKEIVYMVITRDYFANYRYLTAAIKSMQRRLRYFENHPLGGTHGVVKGSMEGFPYAECHFVVSGANVKSFDERDVLVKQLILDLEGNLRHLEDIKLDIESFIENSDLLSLEERTIFRLKFIENKKDREIGEELGYDRSTISKKIDDVINRLPENFGDNEISFDLRHVSHNSHS